MKKTPLLICVIFLNLCNLCSAQTNPTGSFIYKSILRDYIVHLPPSYPSTSNYPVVFNLHGSEQTAFLQQLYSQFDVVADTADFIVVYPNAVGGVWDTVFPNSPIDDVGFISALIDTLADNYDIDLTRVYVTGMSMGSYMSYRLACELNDRIAAIGSVAGLMTEDFFFYCDPVPAIPVLHIHGTADSTILYQGDISFNVPVDSLIQYWVQKDNCPPSPVVTQLPDIDNTDSCTVTISYYGLCQDSGEVVLYTINNGGHTWPGAFPFPQLGNTNQDINASVEIWNFFNRHRLDTTIVGIDQSTIYGHQFLIVYPNPFSENINVKINTSDVKSLVIFNLLGEKVFELQSKRGTILNRGTHVLSTGHLDNGIYFLQLKSGERLNTKKIVKL